jgi:hypothetical protein
MSISMNEIILVHLRNKFDPIQHDNILCMDFFAFFTHLVFTVKI